jgi:hypothetical protein
MARRKRNDSREHFAAFLGFYLPPTLLTEIKAMAVNHGITTSDLARQILAHGLGSAVPIAAAYPDPQTEAKISSVTNATHAVNGLRSLMNQIARHVNSVQELGPHDADLREAIGHCERVAEALLDATVELTAA